MSRWDPLTQSPYHMNLHSMVCKCRIDGGEIQVIHSILQLIPLGSMELRQSKSHRF